MYSKAFWRQQRTEHVNSLVRKRKHTGVYVFRPYLCSRNVPRQPVPAHRGEFQLGDTCAHRGAWCFECTGRRFFQNLRKELEVGGHCGHRLHMTGLISHGLVLFSPWRSRYLISTNSSTPIILACSLLSSFCSQTIFLLGLEQVFLLSKTGDEFVRKWGKSLSIYGDFNMSVHM